MPVEKGTLYVVATPIGNLSDITLRAIEVLRAVDRIAAEDTRHSRRLLDHYGISTSCIAFHAHNEHRLCVTLADDLQKGLTIALITDAGTPLLSDPGFPLIREARERGQRVVPIPGPSALTAALSVSGLPADRFIFEGFLPAKSSARKQRLEFLAGEQRTIVVYEAPHRIVKTLKDMLQAFGSERQAVVARELTKVFETVRQDTLDNLCAWVQRDANQRKGEFVVLVHGAQVPVGSIDRLTRIDRQAERVLKILLAELPVKQAVGLAVKITGVKKNVLYRQALTTGDANDPGPTRGTGHE